MTQKNRQGESRSGRCSICRLVRVLVSDHCHVEGERRERICGTCNTGLGMFHDDPEAMRRAAAYVERWKAIFADDELLAFARSKTMAQYDGCHPRT